MKLDLPLAFQHPRWISRFGMHITIHRIVHLRVRSLAGFTTQLKPERFVKGRNNSRAPFIRSIKPYLIAKSGC